MGSAGFNGLGFAIPVDLFKSTLDELIEKGKVTYAYLGVLIGPVPEEVREHSDIPGEGGAFVEKVIKDGPADEAGIKEEDIILEFDKQPVPGSHELVQMVGRVPVGEKVSLRVYRPKEKKMLTLSFKTAERPVEMADVYTSPEKKEALGITVQDLDETIAEKMGYQDEEGVIVTSVVPDGPAAEFLQAFDLIMKVEWNKVSNVKEFWEEVKKADKEKGVLLLVKRRGRSLHPVIPFAKEEEKD